jgi:hypothetical protein
MDTSDILFILLCLSYMSPLLIVFSIRTLQGLCLDSMDLNSYIPFMYNITCGAITGLDQHTDIIRKLIGNHTFDLIESHN